MKLPGLCESVSRFPCPPLCPVCASCPTSLYHFILLLPFSMRFVSFFPLPYSHQLCPKVHRSTLPSPFPSRAVNFTSEWLSLSTSKFSPFSQPGSLCNSCLCAFYSKFPYPAHLHTNHTSCLLILSPIHCPCCHFCSYRFPFQAQTLFIHTPSQQSVATSSLTSNRTVLEFLSSQKGNRSEEWESEIEGVVRDIERWEICRIWAEEGRALGSGAGNNIMQGLWLQRHFFQSGECTLWILIGVDLYCPMLHFVSYSESSSFRSCAVPPIFLPASSLVFCFFVS